MRHVDKPWALSGWQAWVARRHDALCRLVLLAALLTLAVPIAGGIIGGEAGRWLRHSFVWFACLTPLCYAAHTAGFSLLDRSCWRHALQARFTRLLRGRAVWPRERVESR